MEIKMQIKSHFTYESVQRELRIFMRVTQEKGDPKTGNKNAKKIKSAQVNKRIKRRMIP